MFRKILPAVSVALLLPSAAGAASFAPAARIAGLLGRTTGFEDADFPAIEPDWSVQSPFAQAVPPSVVPDGLWEALPAPDAAALAWLGSRLPGLDPATVKQLLPAEAEAIFAAAAARGDTPLDLFTDSGFRGARAYYLPRELLVDLFARYDVRVLTMVTGSDTRGVPFAMQGLLIGNGRVEALYDRSDFTFRHPDFPEGSYTLKARVSQTILGPGDMAVAGATAHVGWFNPVIRRVVKISPTESRVETNLGSQNEPLTPIRLR